MQNKLLKFEHDEKGIWYFTSFCKASNALGCQPNHIKYFYNQNRDYKGWTIEEIDGSDVIYKYINPERL